MYGLLGNDGNLTLDHPTGGIQLNITTKKFAFNLVNATDNLTLSSVNVHAEITVDYSRLHNNRL